MKPGSGHRASAEVWKQDPLDRFCLYRTLSSLMRLQPYLNAFLDNMPIQSCRFYWGGQTAVTIMKRSK
jgi:hypothetical protein